MNSPVIDADTDNKRGKISTSAAYAIGIAILGLVFCTEVRADCVLPFQINASGIADAGQLTSNNNAVADCTQQNSPAGPINGLQIQQQDETGLVGIPLDGQQLLIGVTGGLPKARSLTAGHGISLDYSAAAVMVSRRSSMALYGAIMSATPTLAATGLTSWLHQGASVAQDSQVGATLDAPASAVPNLSGRYRPAPVPPYTITALIAATRNTDQANGVGLGWYDGSGGLHVISLVNSNPDRSPILKVEKWSSVTTLNGTDVTSSSNGFSQPIWFRLADDGARVSFGFSQDGVNFVPLFDTPKASGFLGAAGYSNIVFITNPIGSRVLGTLLSWRIDAT